MNLRLIILFLLVPLFSYAQSDVLNLSLRESDKIMKDKNYLLKITDKSVSLAKSERAKLNSFWFPQINLSGAFMHFSNDIEVRQSMKSLTDPAQRLISTILPDDKIISGLLAEIGSQTLTFPLMKRNITSVDANVMWPVLTGGKRIYASKLGKQMVNLAGINKEETSAIVQSQLVDAYFGLRLAQRIVEVRRETYNTFRIHYNNAVRLEQNGMMNRAERLFVKVSMDEAKRELESAEKMEVVAQSALKAILNIDSSQNINPISSLFVYEEIPSKDYFKSLVGNTSYAVGKLSVEVKMAEYQKMMNKSAYFPMISIIGKQTIYSDNVPKYLVPRSMVGVAFTWNIFDGLNREASIRQARISQQMLTLAKMKAKTDISVLVDDLYSKINDALDDITALNASMQFSEELLKVRIHSFIEGMATSTEVIDALNIQSKIEIDFLMAYYQYDTALASLLSVCGTPELFWEYCEKGKKENYIFQVFN